MKLTVSTQTKWIPKWRGNDESDDPIVFIHRTPTMALREELVPKPRIKFNISSDGESAGGESEIVVDTTKIIERMVVRIENFDIEITDSETGKNSIVHITKGSDLFGERIPSLIQELVNEAGTYFQNLLNRKEDDSKN